MNEEFYEFVAHIAQWHAAKLEHLKTVQGKVDSNTTIRVDDIEINLNEEQALAFRLGMEACIAEFSQLPFSVETDETKH